MRSGCRSRYSAKTYAAGYTLAPKPISVPPLPSPFQACREKMERGAAHKGGRLWHVLVVAVAAVVVVKVIMMR